MSAYSEQRLSATQFNWPDVACQHKIVVFVKKINQRDKIIIINKTYFFHCVEIIECFLRKRLKLFFVRTVAGNGAGNWIIYSAKKQPWYILQKFSGTVFTAGETVMTEGLELPQTGETLTDFSNTHCLCGTVLLWMLGGMVGLGPWAEQEFYASEIKLVP